MSETRPIDENLPTKFLKADSLPKEISRPTRADHVELFQPSAEALQTLQSLLGDPPHERSRLVGSLGEGGMGSVDLIHDVVLQRRLARKVLHPELRNNTGLTWLFLREARITAHLDHPSIVPVHDLGQDAAGNFYFTMKNVEGVSLTQYVRDIPEGRIDRRTLFEILEALLKICDAVTFAHHRGVLHCDLKPEHIVLGHFGQVYLMDWGIARILPHAAETLQTGEMEDSNLIFGTVEYMSPEQTLGRSELDARTDVFALGAILYFILTRRPLYQPDDFRHGVALARTCRIVPPSQIAGAENVPPELEEIFLRATSYIPDDRYQGVEELAEALRRFLRGEGDLPTTFFAPGEHVVREGDPSDAAFIITKGSCEAYQTIGDERRSLRVMSTGDCFGELALLTDDVRSASVVALEDGVEVHVVTRGVFETEMHELRPWIAQMMRTLAARFREAEERV